MNFVSITYPREAAFNDPLAWLHRIRAYTGVLEALATKHAVVSIGRINYTGTITVNGVRHLFHDAGGRRLPAAWKLNAQARRLHPDIVLVQGMIFPLEVILLRRQLGRTVKIIVQNHAEKAGKGRRRVLQQVADPAIDAYLFTSRERGDEWLREGIIRDPGKIRQVMEASSVFSPGDSRTARSRLGLNAEPVFLWVGRLDTNKDPLTVIKAFLAFPHPSARLYMLFHTRELLPEIEALLEAAPNGRERVVLIGEKSHAEMEAWFQAADYIISGSHYEGSGIAVCEAMSCGCIPVLTDILSFRMMTAGGACGILYPPGDAKAPPSALEQITAKHQPAERQKAFAQFHKEHSFKAIADAIDNIALSL